MAKTSFSPQRRVALALLLAGLGAQAQERERTKLDLRLNASAGVNPDATGRAAPVRVRVYELKDSQAFLEADYFSLDEKDRVLLGADLLVRDEFILRPGETQRIERKSQGATQFIGVLAGYRDLPQATWRALFRLGEAPEAAWYRALAPARKAYLDIDLQAQGIFITERP